MAQEQISDEEKKRLAALEIKNAFGGVEKKEEEEIFELRKKKKLQAAIDGRNR